jgi:hypothetical protein
MQTFLLTFHSFTTPDYLLNRLHFHYGSYIEEVQNRVVEFTKVWILRHWGDWKSRELRAKLLSFYSSNDISVVALFHETFGQIELEEASESIYLLTLKKPEEKVELDFLECNELEVAQEIATIKSVFALSLPPPPPYFSSLLLFFPSSISIS